MEASCRQLTAHSDLSVCSAGSQKEVSQHQRVFIRAEEVLRLGGITFNKRSTFFFVVDFSFCVFAYFLEIEDVGMMRPSSADFVHYAESGADIYTS